LKTHDQESFLVTMRNVDQRDTLMGKKVKNIVRPCPGSGKRVGAEKWLWIKRHKRDAFGRVEK